MLDRLLKNNFADLKGTRIEGQIVVSDELVNIAIQDGLKSLLPTTDAATLKSKKEDKIATAPPIDPKDLLAALNIETLHYRSEKGKAIIDLKASL